MTLEDKINQIEENFDLGWFDARTASNQLTDILTTNSVLSRAEKMALMPRVSQLQTKIAAALSGSKEKVSSVQLESFREKPLKDLLHDWYTMDIEKEGEGRESVLKAISEKLTSLRQEFIDHGNTLGIPEAESLDRWQNFSSLCKITFGLIDYGVMRGDSQNVSQFTSKHDEAFAAARKSGAMTLNGQFNENPLVASVGVDQGTQSASGMGIVQKIAFACFQEMVKLPPSSPGAIHSTGRDQRSIFSRNQGFSSDLDKRMVQAVSGWDQMRLHDGSMVTLNIARELAQFPPEVVPILLDISRWKIARDDLGSKSGIWHLGFNKGAFKYADGASGRPAGVIASILYQVGKNSARENHAAMLQFVDLSHCELMSKGRPAHVSDYHNYKLWSDPQNREVIRYQTEQEEFQVWAWPQWREIQFNRFTPKKWYEDFPALDEYFNQPHEAISADDYTKSRDAVLKIIEMSASADQTILSTNTEQLREKVIVMIKNFSSEIGKALAYIGKYEPGNKYNYVHELILSCFQQYIASIIIAVPGEVSGFTKFGISRSVVSREYEELYGVTIGQIRSTIDLNSTLSGFYWLNTTGKVSDTNLGNGGFIDQPELVRQWRHESKQTQRFQQWRLDNSPELRGFSVLKQADTLTTQPKKSTNTKEGWKSSYEDPQAQRT